MSFKGETSKAGELKKTEEYPQLTIIQEVTGFYKQLYMAKGCSSTKEPVSMSKHKAKPGFDPQHWNTEKAHIYNTHITSKWINEKFKETDTTICFLDIRKLNSSPY